MTDLTELLRRVAVLETRAEERQRALELQAEENARRFGELNHAHRDNLEKEQRLVTRAEWEASHRELAVKGESEDHAIEARITDIEKGTNLRLIAIEQRLTKMVSLGMGIGIGAGLAGGGIVALVLRLLGDLK